MTIFASEKDLLIHENFRINTGNLLFSTLAINILSLALPVMTLQVYDRILPNPGSGTLPVLITGVCIAILLEAALRMTRSYTLAWSGAAYEHGLSCKVMNHILNADLSKIGSYGVGEYLHRMGGVGKLRDFYNGYALTTIFELLFVPVYFALLIYISGPLCIVPAVILMVFTIISLWQGQTLRHALKERDEKDDSRYNFLIESLDGIHTLKSFALENLFQRRYETLEQASTLANYKVTQATANTFNMGSVFSNLMVAAVIAVGALFALNGQITTGALIATVLLSGRMMQPIQKVLALWAKYQDFTLARTRVEDMFSIPQNIPVVTDLKALREGRVQTKDLSFRYKDDMPWLLKDLNMTINKGEVVLLSGPHGSGKSTLCELISGIYPPGRGEILVDGQNILTYPPEELVKHVGYIRTDGLIFRGTIRDNMTCFGQIPESEVYEVASLLKVDRDVATLPSGFDTLLNGNATDSIPPGLKQRISMVRVLAARPRLILFDNAVRSLDREGYSLVYSLLGRLKGKVSMILISDDQNMQALADRFLILKDGAVKEYLDFDEAVTKNKELRL